MTWKKSNKSLGLATLAKRICTECHRTLMEPHPNTELVEMLKCPLCGFTCSEDELANKRRKK